MSEVTSPSVSATPTTTTAAMDVSNNNSIAATNAAAKTAMRKRTSMTSLLSSAAVPPTPLPSSPTHTVQQQQQIGIALQHGLLINNAASLRLGVVPSSPSPTTAATVATTTVTGCQPMNLSPQQQMQLQQHQQQQQQQQQQQHQLQQQMHAFNQSMYHRQQQHLQQQQQQQQNTSSSAVPAPDSFVTATASIEPITTVEAVGSGFIKIKNPEGTMGTIWQPGKNHLTQTDTVFVNVDQIKVILSEDATYTNIIMEDMRVFFKSCYVNGDQVFKAIAEAKRMK